MTRRILGTAIASLACASAAGAQTTVTLPDTSQTSVVSVSVSEQAQVVVPGGITFNVTDVTASTPSAAVSVGASQIVLASSSRQLRVSVKADAAFFTPPEAGATTWAAADLSWEAAAWTAGLGSPGTLSSSAYNTIATCDANTTACSTSALVFTLGAKPAVQRSGTHTLTVTWKFESIGS